MLCKVADLYGVTIDYLLGRTEYSEGFSGISEPVSKEALQALHGHPVWHQELGWGLVDALSNKIIFANHSEIVLPDAANLRTLPPAFSVGYCPTQALLPRDELPEVSSFWVEPISPDPDARKELRGWGVHIKAPMFKMSMGKSSIWTPMVPSGSLSIRCSEISLIIGA